MLELLITAGIVIGTAAGVFVGLVALMLLMVGVYAAADIVLNELTRPRNVWRPPENQIQEVYKDYIQRIRETAAYGAPLFNLVEDERET